MNDSMISDSIWKMSDYLSRYYGKKAIIMEFKVISPKKEKSLEENINPIDMKLSSNMNNLLLKMKEDKFIEINWNYKSQKNEKKICYVSLNINPDDINDYIKDILSGNTIATADNNQLKGIIAKKTELDDVDVERNGNT